MKVRFLKRAAAILLAMCMVFPICASASEIDTAEGVEAVADEATEAEDVEAVADEVTEAEGVEAAADEATEAEGVEAAADEATEAEGVEAMEGDQMIGGAFGASAVNMAINKLYTFGLSAAGTTLTKIANATGNEAIEDVVTFLNKWVFGNGQGQANAQIKAMCQEILNELKIIEETLTVYTTEMEQLIGKQNYESKYDKLQSKWESDIVQCEKDNNIVYALEAYKAYMELLSNCDPANTDPTQQQQVNAAREKVFDEFWKIYTDVHHPSSSDSDTADKRKGLVFGDSTVGDKIYKAVRDMVTNLNKDTDSYADALAQLAYEALPYADQQYEYIRTGIDRWLTEITMADLLYQEYLTQRAEYLQSQNLLEGDGAEAQNFKTLLEQNAELTETLSEQISAMLDHELVVSVSDGIMHSLNEYPRGGDSTVVIMKNTNFLSSQTWKDVQQKKSYVSYPQYVDQYVEFRRVFTLTESGFHSYYVKTGDKNEMMISTMDFKCAVSNYGDTHDPSVDFLNLFDDKTYSDGTGSFRAANGPAELAELFHTNAYLMCGNNPKAYLAQYCDYMDNNKLVILFPGYKEAGKPTFIWDTAYGSLKNTLDISNATMTYSDWTGNKTNSMSLEKVHNSDVKYAMIMIPDGQERHTVQLETNYSGSQIYIKDEAGNEYHDSKVTLDAGSTYTVYFKPGDAAVVDSLILQRRDDAHDKDTVTGEDTVLLTREQVAGMEVDDYGYYSFECPACYADTTLYLKVETGMYTVTAQNLRPNATTESGTAVTLLGSPDNRYAAKTTVNFTVSDQVEKVFLIHNKTLEQVAFDGGNGSFTMPQSDVILGYVLKGRTHTFDEDGFCIDLYCGFYEPATRNSNGIYEITNAGQMFWFASLVNGDKSHAEFAAKDVSAKGILMKDIDLKSLEWAPIQGYTGVFDGNGHTLSNLKITTGQDNIGLFGSTVGATVKNLEVTGQMVLSPDGSVTGIAGVIGCADGGVISHVSSCVEITNTQGELKHVGGIVGEVKSSQTTIEKCIYDGKMEIANSGDCIGGVLGYSNSGAYINNCANLGTITTAKNDAFTGGILGYLNNSTPTVKNCYNYGTVSNGENDRHCGAIAGWVRDYGSGRIADNYYLEDSASRAFGSESKAGLSAVSKSIEEFKAGEVAYLLNKGVTDGTQVWYQNIDNGEEPDFYPVFDGGTVYRITDSLYSNSPKTLEFDQDDDGNLVIRTYDDLVKLAKLVRSDYDIYGSEDYILENNIVVPSGTVWTAGIGAVSGDMPFDGTFDGNGYGIMGLNIGASSYGGLFELIGENGRVENLFILNCMYAASCENAGSIAAMNNGTIDHCTNGINVGSALIFKDPVTQKPIKASEFNSEIKGTLSGGIVAQNAGTITGCRNASVVTGTECGGIAGMNTGTIYGCANNGTIGVANSSQTKTAGGIAAKNGGSIASSYNSAKVYGDSEKAVGSVAGLNGFEAKTAPEIKNVFYTTVNGLKAVGTGSSKTDLGTGNIAKKQSEMQKDAFVDELNKVTDASVRWSRTSTLNSGFPKIENIIFDQIERKLESGISVKGAMHSSLNICYDLMDDKHDEYKKIVAAALPNGDRKVLKGYTVSLSDEKGNSMFAELWIQDEIEVSVPVNSEHAVLLGLDSDGKVVECKPVSYKDGVATFRLSEPISFILVDTASASGTTGNSANTANASNTASAVNSAATGDTPDAVFGFIMLLAGGLLLAAATWEKRKKING